MQPTNPPHDGGVADRETIRPASFEAVVVAVPARNEAGSVGACIRTVDAAAGTAGIPTIVVIACDSCDDDTAERARRTPTHHVTLEVVEGDWGGAGAARAAAVAFGLSSVAAPAAAVWVANTDADTLVPPDWLTTQLRLGRHHAAVAGIVDLDPRRTARDLLARFRTSYLLDGACHAHVHGANLGLRADAYLSAGGWCPNTTVGEDHGLWNRVVADGASVVQSTHVRVVTSARTASRVDGGFASALRALTVPADSVTLGLA